MNSAPEFIAVEEVDTYYLCHNGHIIHRTRNLLHAEEWLSQPNFYVLTSLVKQDGGD